MVFRLTGDDTQIYLTKDSRGGSRLLRRNAATRMLEAATPLPTISAVLGHADPDSTRVYMATHRGGMLACVLPVPEGGSS